MSPYVLKFCKVVIIKPVTMEHGKYFETREQPRFTYNQRSYTLIQPKRKGGPGDVTFVDTHVHTDHSDGVTTVGQVEEICRAKGIGCCITDHNEIRGTMELVERQLVHTLPAIEVGSKEQIELLVYFRQPESLVDFYKKHVEPHRTKRWYAFLPRSLDYMVAAVSEYDVLLSLPHPFAPLWKNIEYGRKRRDAVYRTLSGTDCIEVVNGSQTARANRRALKLCEQLGRIPMGGSDSHHPDTIGSVMVAFNQSVSSENLFDAIHDGHIFGILGHDGRSKYVANVWHLAKTHSRKFIQSLDM